jgi:hypothetical protein
MQMTANYAEIAKHVTIDNEGITLSIKVDEVACGVKVTGIGMFVDKEGNGDGDLAVNWDMTGLENTGGGNMGTLLMRGWQDEVGNVMGRFYWNNEFNARLKELLIAAGFSNAAAHVTTSEWGMQEEGRASYDASSIADEVRECVAKLQLA